MGERTWTPSGLIAMKLYQHVNNTAQIFPAPPSEGQRSRERTYVCSLDMAAEVSGTTSGLGGGIEGKLVGLKEERTKAERRRKKRHKRSGMRSSRVRLVVRWCRGCRRVAAGAGSECRWWGSEEVMIQSHCAMRATGRKEFC